ncbi:aldehyde dehydrogenase [Pseudonocardia kujensis]|uniref:aldehyde dehydrogenase n=1 Tax=Pseudonocardia kujensis TaxID=1128675 RepID=UPI001E30F82D|nr:aldehyde dehydrogenase [Pseudonocardia kujensis]MCE0762072.1 aldehyde dehydrogenase [Pseudonocardia kujensis]
MTSILKLDQELDRHQFFINGEWAEPSAGKIHQVVEAATGEVLASASLGTSEDIDRAVRAARHALDHGPWGRTEPAERAAAMRRFATALEARADATSTLVSRENGMPITLSHAFNGAAPAALLRMYADLAETLAVEAPRPSASGTTFVRREPVGVVGAITPWNYPQAVAIYKIGPALAAGCTVVLKHSPDTALDSYVLGEAAAEAELPPGVLNIVLADRDEGHSLVTHPLVDKIAFTGSTAAGRIIGAECGRLVRRCTLELGGKSAAIFCDDGDIDTLLAGIGNASFMNNSQTCTTQSRILVSRQRYDEVVEAVAEYARDLVVGDPLDENTACGPMATQHHLARVMGYIEIGKSSAARLVAGGGRPKDADRGWFVEPTVFADVDNDDQLAREEIFGPVMAIIPFQDDADAVRIANDSNYGLGGSVWSQDADRALAIARQVRTGTVGVNSYNIDLGAPFGGMKDSGIGRELGPEAIDAYLEYKSIYTTLPS